jgi:hypothetical protein
MVFPRPSCIAIALKKPALKPPPQTKNHYPANGPRERNKTSIGRSMIQMPLKI